MKHFTAIWVQNTSTNTTKYGRIYQVKVQSDYQHRALPDDIAAIHVKNDQGKMVPLGTLIQASSSQNPSVIEHYNLFRTASISGQPSPGYSTEESHGRLWKEFPRPLPDDYDFDWSGMSHQQRESGKMTAIVLMLAILSLPIYF